MIHSKMSLRGKLMRETKISKNFVFQLYKMIISKKLYIVDGNEQVWTPQSIDGNTTKKGMELILQIRKNEDK